MVGAVPCPLVCFDDDRGQSRHCRDSNTCTYSNLTTNAIKTNNNIKGFSVTGNRRLTVVLDN